LVTLALRRYFLADLGELLLEQVLVVLDRVQGRRLLRRAVILGAAQPLRIPIVFLQVLVDAIAEPTGLHFASALRPV